MLRHINQFPKGIPRRVVLFCNCKKQKTLAELHLSFKYHVILPVTELLVPLPLVRFEHHNCQSIVAGVAQYLNLSADSHKAQN